MISATVSSICHSPPSSARARKVGTSRLKITPTLPQPKKSPLKLLGCFLFLPPLRSLKTQHSELGREELQRRQAEGSKQRGSENEREKQVVWGRRKRGRMAITVVFLISAHHFLSSLFVAAFTARQLLETSRSNWMKTFGNASPGHVSDPTSSNYCEAIYL